MSQGSPKNVVKVTYTLGCCQVVPRTSILTHTANLFEHHLTNIVSTNVDVLTKKA